MAGSRGKAAGNTSGAGRLPRGRRMAGVSFGRSDLGVESGHLAFTGRGGELRLTNRWFDALDRGSAIGPAWIALGVGTADGEAGAGRSLTNIVVTEARAMVERLEQTRRVPYPDPCLSRI